MKWGHQPKIFPIAQTMVMPDVIADMLDAIGADGYAWVAKAEQGEPSGAEMLTEVVGRLCYKSYEAGLNPNVTRVREGNQQYIRNILESKHGSVLEHASVTIGFIGVSRVFTHEIVRHRPGSAFSQESLRFVRVDDLSLWYPDIFGAHEVTSTITEEESDEIEQHMVEAVSAAERAYAAIGRILKIDQMSDFGLKKRLTSAMRRILPDGMATNIAVTSNHRGWRHIIANRTSVHAEEELRWTIGKVAEFMKEAYPNIYQDMHKSKEGAWEFDNDKI